MLERFLNSGFFKRVTGKARDENATVLKPSPTNLLGPRLTISLNTPPIVGEALSRTGDFAGSVKSYLNGLNAFTRDGELWLADLGKRSFYSSAPGYYHLKNRNSEVEKLEETRGREFERDVTAVGSQFSRDWSELSHSPQLRAGPLVNGFRPAFHWPDKGCPLIKWSLADEQVVALVVGREMVDGHLWSLAQPLWGKEMISVRENTLLTGEGEKVCFARSSDGALQVEAYELLQSNGVTVLYPISGQKLYKLSCIKSKSRVTYSGQSLNDTDEWTGGIPVDMLPELPLTLERDSSGLVWRSSNSESYARSTYVSEELSLALQPDSLTGKFEHSHHTDASA